MRRLLITILAAAALTAASGEKRIFTGVITDTMCGLNHSGMNISPDAKCVRECAKSGSRNKYALHDGKNMYVLSDQKRPEQFAAQKVRVTGVLYSKTGIIKVEDIQPAK